MASRGESAASGASAASSVVSVLESGSTSAADSLASGAAAGCPAVDRSRATTSSPSASSRRRQVDRDLQPFSQPPARFARAAERDREAGGIESQQTYAAGSDRALRRVDPGDRCARRQRVEIVDRKNEPVRRRRRRVRMSDPGAEGGEKRARRRRRRMARFEKFRPRGADGRLAPRALARRFGPLGGRFRLGCQRGDALIEPRRALIEVASPFAGLEVEQPRAAQEQVREPERAPEVERDRQCAEDVQNLRRPVEPFAVGRDPVGDRLERVAQPLDRGERRRRRAESPTPKASAKATIAHMSSRAWLP